MNVLNFYNRSLSALVLQTVNGFLLLWYNIIMMIKGLYCIMD